jgi:hypothetical protein
MPDDQLMVTRGRTSVVSTDDFKVGAADAESQHANNHSAVGNRRRPNGFEH